MDVYESRLTELHKRIFYLSSLEQAINSEDPLSSIKGLDLTILMTPFSVFNYVGVDLPDDKYHNEVLKYLREGDTPGIIITSHLDRLIIETIKGRPKQPRIFMQAGNEANDGFVYYRDKGMDRYNNQLMRLVEHIKPKTITIGGAFLAETEKELKEWDLEEFSWEYSADSGSYVGPVYLMFRDKYLIRIAENLVKRG